MMLFYHFGRATSGPLCPPPSVKGWGGEANPPLPAPLHVSVVSVSFLSLNNLDWMGQRHWGGSAPYRSNFPPSGENYLGLTSWLFHLLTMTLDTLLGTSNYLLKTLGCKMISWLSIIADSSWTWKDANCIYQQITAFDFGHATGIVQFSTSCRTEG